MASELYRSNGGRGPLLAEIIGYDARDRVILERWDPGSKAERPRRVRFTLPRRFFHSKSCGWKRVRGKEVGDAE